MRKLKTILAVSILGMVMLFSGCEPQKPNLISFSVTPPSVTLTQEGQTLDLKITINPADADVDFSWTSNNTSIVTVDEIDDLTARVTAVAEGTTTLTVVSGAKTKSVSVTVRFGGALEEGDGTEAKPYMVSQAIGFTDQTPTVEGWVGGYIVGGVKNGTSTNISDDPSQYIFGTTDVRTTCVFIADDPNETNRANVLIVKLNDTANVPAGFRSAMNLVDNVANYQTHVKVKGSIYRYFGVPGIRDITAYTGGGHGDGSQDDPDVIFYETFAASQGDFTIQNVTMPAPLTNVWRHNEEYRQMAAGAYVNSTNHATEAWLISPAINLSEVSAANFTFDHAGKQFGAPTTNLTIQVSTNYSEGAPSTATWTELSIPNHLANESNVFKSAGDMSLDSYCGQANVHIAFKYTSTSTGAGNWYVRNAKVKK